MFKIISTSYESRERKLRRSINAKSEKLAMLHHEWYKNLDDVKRKLLSDCVLDVQASNAVVDSAHSRRRNCKQCTDFFAQENKFIMAMLKIFPLRRDHESCVFLAREDIFKKLDQLASLYHKQGASVNEVRCKLVDKVGVHPVVSRMVTDSAIATWHNKCRDPELCLKEEAKSRASRTSVTNGLDA